MIPAPNPFKTHVIGAPSNMDDCHPIEATVAVDEKTVPGEKHLVFSTAWEPSPEEIEALAAGAKVWLTLWTNALPPACIGVGDRPPDF